MTHSPFMKRSLCLVGVLVYTGFLGGCGKSLKTENAQLWEENKALRSQLASKQQELDAANVTIANLQASRRTPAAPNNGIFKDGPRQATARIPGDVLFASGKTTLKSSARSTLGQVISILKSRYAGHEIRVVGYTDTDPIRKSPWKTNLRLGAERAMAVHDYLKAQGIRSSRMHVASYGENKAQGSKSKSRRVEIVVLIGK
jgi:chemotaxis protein MotB